jgi:hypothetical protein
MDRCVYERRVFKSSHVGDKTAKPLNCHLDKSHANRTATTRQTLRAEDMQRMNSFWKRYNSWFHQDHASGKATDNKEI